MEIDLSDSDIDISKLRDHVRERYPEDDRRANRVFLLVAFGDIEMDEFRERFNEIHGIRPTELEVEIARRQVEIYEYMKEDVRESVRNVLFYIYGSNNVDEETAQKSHEQILEDRNSPELIFDLKRVLWDVND